MKWHKVSKANPCPICGKADWCGFNDEMTMAICMRVQNDYPSKNGGYIYVYEDGRWQQPIKRAFVPFLKSRPAKLPASVLKPALPAWTAPRLTSAEVTKRMADDAVITLSNETFGVREICGADGIAECMTLAGFGCFESRSHMHCLGIPMRDGGGAVIGIRYRNILDKKKFSLTGGRNGLFFSKQIFKHKVDTLLICEGATDAIAVSALGLDCIGRPSCSTGADLIKTLLNIVRPRNIVYIADNDHAKLIAEEYREAGRTGAQKLAKDIKKPYKMISPLAHKDIREYILDMRSKGLETAQIAQAILDLIKDAIIRLPTR